MIVQKIAESHIEYAVNKVSAYEVWKHLEVTFQRKSVVAQMRLRTQLLTGKHNPNKETMQKHFQKFDRLVRQLKAAGGTMDDEDVDLLSHSGSILSLPNTSGAAIRASPFPITGFRFNSVFSSIRLFVITTCCCNQLFARETALFYVCTVLLVCL
jgi:hypothetical protein